MKSRIRPSFIIALLLSAFTLQASAAPETETATHYMEPAPQFGPFGFDIAGMDKSIKPGGDFYNYANGNWAKTTPIPAYSSNYGIFTQLSDSSAERLRNLLDAEQTKVGSKAGMAYASYLDAATIERLGLNPIRPWLKKVARAKSKSDFENVIGEALPMGIGSMFKCFTVPDEKKPDRYILEISQDGLGLPDRDFYLAKSQKYDAIRAAYKRYLVEMLTIAGEANAAARADAILALETRFAEAHWRREDSYDSAKSYNIMTLAQLDALAPGMKFSAILGKLYPGIDKLIVREPGAITKLANIFAEADIAVLKDQMLVSSLTAYSEVLPNSVSNTVFSLFGTALEGRPQPEARSARAVRFVTDVLPDEIGRAYATAYFPPANKAAAQQIVSNITEAMRRRIDGLAWMQSVTKVKAKEKLARLTVKVGYPDKWHDYSALRIDAGDTFGNLLRANQWQFADKASKAGAPVRQWEWGLYPQSVNVSTNFNMLTVELPAALIAPPFFDPKADDAVNYGGIGAAVARQLSLHFDEFGSNYDASGQFANWWTDKDTAAYQAVSDKLVAQYDAYQIFPDTYVNGRFTLSENIGDLVGLTIAYDAYKLSLNGRTPPVLEGFTGDQRFFLSWAQVWRRNYRDTNLRNRLLTDPHSPSQQRAWVVRNIDKWYDAFQPSEGEKLYLKPEDRVRIW